MKILTPDELEQLTRRCRCDGQRRELEHLGIPYRVRRDGSLLVVWQDVAPLGGSTIGSAEPREPEMHL